MHLATLECCLQLRERTRCRDAHALSQLPDGGLRTCPDDVVHREVVSVEHFLPAVEVYCGGKVWQVETEKVSERAVLSKMIYICG